MPHADNGHSRAVEAGPVKNRPPAFERSRAHDGIAIANHAAEADGETDREFRRRLCQKIRHDREPDPAARWMISLRGHAVRSGLASTVPIAESRSSVLG